MSKQNTPIKEVSMPIADQREWAKIGMVASMGVLVATGFMGRKGRNLHIGAGLALIGCSYWHYRLYQPKSPSR